MNTSIKITLTPQEDRELRLVVRRQKAAHWDKASKRAASPFFPRSC